MEAFSATCLLKKLLDTVLHVGSERMSLLLGLDDEIKKLRLELPLIQAVLVDAEEKQVSQPDVLIWLQRLKDFALDVEDIFDEFETEVAINPRVEFSDDATNIEKTRVLRAAMGNNRVRSLQRYRQLLGNCFCSGSSSATTGKSSPVITRLNIADRVKALMKTFDELLETKKKLNLIATPAQPMPKYEIQQTSERPQVSSIHEAEFSMMGRDQDKNNLIEKLLDRGPQPSKVPRVSVLSIVGMGGIGKSTLAKVVYNDHTVQTHFLTRKWVSVGEKFDSKSLIKNLLDDDLNQSVTNKKMDDLHKKLKNECGKWGKFLIVLDDVWNCDASKWEDIWIPLSHGMEGSKMLITCRSPKVIEATHNRPTIILKKLDDDNCFSIFIKHAFPYGGFEVHQNLVNVGKEIVKHLGGLPLAAKLVGGSLFDRLDEGTWRQFLIDEPWATTDEEDSIMGSLKWSYNMLPPHLKQCFGYCSLLCKDIVFYKKDLIYKWIAMGLVQPQGSKQLEDIGNEYFTILFQLSFFEITKCVWEREAYMIHDLIHDLAQIVSSRECRNFHDHKYTKKHNNEHVRHVFFENPTETKGIQEYQKIRSVVLDIRKPWKMINAFLLNLRYVRVLHISYPIERMTESRKLSVSHLKHLRYLSVPSSTLLPENVSDLHNLQYLLFNVAPIVRICENVYLRDMNKLTNLRLLDGVFVVGKERGYGIENLGGLQELQGTLRIGNLENVIDKEDAMKAMIQDKKHLKKLSLLWSEIDSEKQESHHNNEHVLEGLEPYQNIQSLQIIGYGGLQFPKWIADITLRNLRSLMLSKCQRVKYIPALGHLPCLKKLNLAAMVGVSTIQEELCGFWTEDRLPFAVLEVLEFWGMEKWSEWLVKGWHFSVLNRLGIYDCKKLLAIPPILNNTIKNLALVYVNLQEVPSFEGLINVCRLAIRGCSSVSKALLGLIHAKTQRVRAQTTLVAIFPQLSFLELSDLQLFDAVIGNADVFCTASKLSDVLLITELDELVDDHWGDGETDHARGDQWEQFTSLRELRFCYCKGLFNLPPLLYRLPSLQKLTIRMCNDIKALPDDGLPKSLQYLKIINSPSCPLRARCKKDTGQDWHKVRHVSVLDFSWLDDKDEDTF